jgi:hypothetical protein
MRKREKRLFIKVLIIKIIEIKVIEIIKKLLIKIK